MTFEGWELVGRRGAATEGAWGAVGGPRGVGPLMICSAVNVHLAAGVLSRQTHFNKDELRNNDT